MSTLNKRIVYKLLAALKAGRTVFYFLLFASLGQMFTRTILAKHYDYECGTNWLDLMRGTLLTSYLTDCYS